MNQTNQPKQPEVSATAVALVTADQERKVYEETASKILTNLVKKYGTISEVMRHLYEVDKLTIGQIAKLLNKRYQHVRNVVTTPVKTKGTGAKKSTQIPQELIDKYTK